MLAGEAGNSDIHNIMLGLASLIGFIRSRNESREQNLKKMHLNRETLRSLENENLSAVVGGVTAGSLCQTKNPTVCNPLSGCVSCDDTCLPCDTTKCM